MANTVGSILDGTPGYGSRVVTFSVSGPYIAESIQITRPHTDAFDMKSQGGPNRARYVLNRATLTMVLQAPTGSVGWPKGGETFTGTFDDNFGPETFVIMWPQYAETNDPSALRKINVEAFQVVNSITTTAPQGAQP